MSRSRLCVIFLIVVALAVVLSIAPVQQTFGANPEQTEAKNASEQPPATRPTSTIGSADPDLDLRPRPELPPAVLEVHPDLPERLFSDDRMVRRKLVDDLANIHPVGMSLLIYLLGDVDSQVRSAASHALAEACREQGIEVPAEPLMQLLRTAPREGRVRAVYWLDKLGSAEAAPLLAEVARTDDPQLTGRALRALANTAPDLARETAEQILANRESPACRVDAAQYLAKTADEGAAPLLAESLSDPDVQIRYWCIGAIRRLEYRPAIPHLLRILLEENPDLRAMVVWTFTAPGLATPEAGEGLIQFLKEVEDLEFSGSNFFDVSGRPPKLPEWLVEQTKHANRGHAINGLRLIKDVRAVPVLLDIIYSARGGQAELIVSTIETIGGPTAVEALASIAQSPTGESQEYAFAALLRLLPEPEVIPRMLAILRAVKFDDSDRGMQIRRRAAETIGRAIGVPEYPSKAGGTPIDAPGNEAILRVFHVWDRYPYAAPKVLQGRVVGLEERFERQLGPVWVKDDLAVVQYDIFSWHEGWPYGEQRRSKISGEGSRAVLRGRYAERGGKILLQRKDGRWRFLALFDGYIV